MTVESDALAQQLTDHISTDDKRINIIQSDIKEIKVSLDNKVNFPTFIWILGILMTITLGLLGLIYSKVENIDTKSNNTQNDVGIIKTDIGWIKQTLTTAEITK